MLTARPAGYAHRHAETEDVDLKTAIDLACGAAAGRPPNVGNVCGDGLTVYVPGGMSYLGGPMQETGMNIVDALGTESRTPVAVHMVLPGLQPERRSRHQPSVQLQAELVRQGPKVQPECLQPPARRQAGPSFAFQVNQGGASLCLPPRAP